MTSKNPFEQRLRIDVGRVAAQVAVEEDVAAHPEHAVPWPAAVAERCRRLQPDGRDAPRR